ncbi:hypothetical protein ZHAS_00011430 [Anopheles sinensis]|uniref:Uncharacterized protein n=1 Tax=Anopheles sinensis TaxID=74873 RepID=A0A084W0F5_ANOSI|nr:hypothetical protein ZHAS_00011430 [Anopheles sinensis]
MSNLPGTTAGTERGRAEVCPYQHHPISHSLACISTTTTTTATVTSTATLTASGRLGSVPSRGAC